MTEHTVLVATTDNSTGAILNELTYKMHKVLTQNLTTITSSHENFGTQIGIKLDGTNYALWSPMMEMYIAGKDKLSYITGDTPHPVFEDPTFRKVEDIERCGKRMANKLNGLLPHWHLHSISDCQIYIGFYSCYLF